MKEENHTVTLPVEDYIKYREFYQNKPVYDMALNELLNSINKYNFAEAYKDADNILLKKGIEIKMDRNGIRNFMFKASKLL